MDFSQKCTTKLSVRVVKGDRLKICCASFVGSNPTSTITFPLEDGFLHFSQKCFQLSVRVVKGGRFKICCVKLRGFESHLNYLVRLAQLVEHRSYEPKVASSILAVNIWSERYSSRSHFRCSVGGYHTRFSLS